MKNYIGVHLEKTGGDREKAALSTGVSVWKMNRWWQAIRDKTEGPSIFRKGSGEKKSEEPEISSINEKKMVKKGRKRTYILKVNRKVAKKLTALEKKDLNEILLAIRTAEGNIGVAREFYNTGKGKKEKPTSKKEFKKLMNHYGISFRKRRTVNQKP